MKGALASGSLDWNANGLVDPDPVGVELNNDNVCLVIKSPALNPDDVRSELMADEWSYETTARIPPGSDDRYRGGMGLRFKSGGVDASSSIRAYMVQAVPTDPVEDDTISTRFLGNGNSLRTIKPGPNNLLDTPVQDGDQLFGFDIVAGQDITCQTRAAEGPAHIVLPEPWFFADNKTDILPGRDPGILTGFDDWANIDILKHFDDMGGTGDLDIPRTVRISPPKDLPREVLSGLVRDEADLAVTVDIDYEPLSGRAIYTLLVRNDGPSFIEGGLVQARLPATARDPVCDGCASVSVDREGIVRTAEVALSDLGVGVEKEIKLSVALDSEFCDTPEVYNFYVESTTSAADGARGNDTFVTPFPDSDGDGKPDVCSWQLGDFAIYGFHSVAIGSQSQVFADSGDSIVAAGGTQTLQVSSSSVVDTLLSNGSIFLENGAVAKADAWAAGSVTTQVTARIEGERREGVAISPELPEVDLQLSWSAVTADYDIYRGQTLTLAPGRYDRVVVYGGATLVLREGDYSINELILESDSAVVTNGAAVRVFVRDGMTLRGDWSSDPAQTLLAYTGTRDIHVTVPVQGTLLAPSTRVTLAMQSPAAVLSGAILAKDVVMQGSSKVEHVPYLGRWPW